MDNVKTKKQNPISWVPSVYFAMGMPFVVLNMVAVLMFKGLEISDAQIAFWTSLIMLPWTLKPLWSPFLGMFKTKKYFVVITQLVTGVTFGLVALSLQLPHFFAIAIALLAIIAFSGATHDIATDGVYMTELTPNQQAQYIGWQGAFYNLAKVVATGALVYFAGLLIAKFSGSLDPEAINGTNASIEDAAPFIAKQHAWMVIMFICGAIMVLLGLYHAKVLPSGGTATAKVESVKESFKELWEVFRLFFTKKHVAYYLFFVIIYRFAEGFAIKIVPLFLNASRDVGGMGLSVEQIGIYYGTFGAIAFIVGSILGGYFISSIGLKKALFILCFIFNMPFAVYMLFAIFQPTEMWMIASGIVIEYFGYGFGFVGLTLFMMQQISPGKHQMAHYAFASGIMNLGVMLPGMMSGYMSDWLGYKNFFIWVMIATIPALLITYFVPFSHPDNKGN